MKAQPTTENTPATTPAGELAAEAKPAEAPAVVVAATDPIAQFKATLGQVHREVRRHQRRAWAAEGLTYEAALEKHAAELAPATRR
jgi:hypothetical protein